MTAKPDLVGVVDTAYRLGSCDATWLQDIVGEAERSLRAPLGVCAFMLDASDLARPSVSTLAYSGSAPPVDVPAMHAAVPPEAVALAYANGAANTLSDITGGARAWRQSPIYLSFYAPHGVKDCVGISALDAQRRGCVVAVALARPHRLSRAETSRYSRLAAHLAAALRLRRALSGGEFRADLGEGTDAVLDAGGRVLDAEGAAVDAPARAALRAMALRLDHARTRLRREDADLALEAWTALVSGRWTLLDHFDTDGRHFLVARRNTPDLAMPVALDPLERMVASAAAIGHPNKLIAYELGLPAATVSRLLHSALGKLGLGSAAELASVLGAFVPTPPKDGAT